jgi:type I restriction enzyme M protein
MSRILKLDQKDINNPARAVCDTFRGVMDADGYKDYILAMLFVKYISDLWKGHYEEYRRQYGDDDARIRRKQKRDLMQKLLTGQWRVKIKEVSE